MTGKGICHICLQEGQENLVFLISAHESYRGNFQSSQMTDTKLQEASNPLTGMAAIQRQPDRMEN